MLKPDVCEVLVVALDQLRLRQLSSAILLSRIALEALQTGRDYGILARKCQVVKLNVRPSIITINKHDACESNQMQNLQLPGEHDDDRLHSKFQLRIFFSDN